MGRNFKLKQDFNFQMEITVLAQVVHTQGIINRAPDCDQNSKKCDKKCDNNLKSAWMESQVNTAVSVR